MAALINLELIRDLETESEDYLRTAERNSFGWKNPGQIDSVTFMKCVKVHWQAKNLHEKLTGLQQVCSDFIAGNFQSYIDFHVDCCEPDEPDQYDPFDNLTRFFGDDSPFPFADRLPERIEQYAELVALASTYSKAKAAWRKEYALQDTDFGIYPERIAIELTEIKVDYCLDGYNEFYWRSMDLMNSYRQTGDVQACTAEILSLFTQP